MSQMSETPVPPASVPLPPGLLGWMTFVGVMTLISGILEVLTCVGIPLGILLIVAAVSMLGAKGVLQTVGGVDPRLEPFFAKLKTQFDYTYIDELPRLELDDPSGQPAAEVPVGTKETVTAMTTLEQPLFAGLSILSQYQLADLDRKEANFSRSDTRQELILNTYEAYFGVLLAEKAVEVAQRRRSVEVVDHLVEPARLPGEGGHDELVEHVL